MKTINLLRHFKVKDDGFIMLNSKEFNQWVSNYDKYELEFQEVDLPKSSTKAYVSTEDRAIRSAELLNLEYELSDKIIEVKIEAFINTKLKLPKIVWLIIGRVLWYFNLSKVENYNCTVNRANQFLAEVVDNNSDNILLLSHGLFLRVLEKELRKKGYVGTMDTSPKNAKVYTFSKEYRV